MPERTSSPGLTTRSHHLHIGLGKLGLGLVLECLLENRPLIVLQRVSKNWPTQRCSQLSGKDVSLENKKNSSKESQTSSFKRSVRVLYNPPEFELEVDAHGQFKSYLVFYDESRLESISWLLDHVASVTLSVGDKDIQIKFAAWIDKLPNRNHVVVYPFENLIADELKHGQLDRPTRQVLPDRVCGEGITLSPSNERISINVESYCQVVIWAEQEEVSNTFKDWVVAVDSENLFNHYHGVKRRLVNGLHFNLAVFCYSHLKDKGLPVEKWSDQYLFFLMGEIMQKSSKSRLCIDTLIGAQAMRSLIEAKKFSSEELDYLRKGREMEELYFELVDYAQRSITRFQAAPDRISRIYDFLNPKKIADKADEHIEELQKFVTIWRPEIDDFKVRSRPWINEIQFALDHLRFCHRNLDVSAIEHYMQEKDKAVLSSR